MRSSFSLCLCFLLVVCLATFGSSAAFAQTGTTSIRGTVMDASGAVVPGAKVTLTSRELSVERTTTTTPVGQYEFVALQPGSYDLTSSPKASRNGSRRRSSF